MLTLAQFWNLLAGYGGLVSVGQQAFVGIGAYAMFAGVILLGWNPVLAIPLGGLAALVLAVPTAFFAFRLQGAYFAIGTWVIAEVTRLLIAQWKALGGGTGTSLPREATRNIMGTDLIQALFGVREAAARDILTYLAGAAARGCRHRRHLLAAAHPPRPGAVRRARQRRGRPRRSGVDAGRLEMGRLSCRRLRHRPDRRADLSSRRRASRPTRPSRSSTGRPM